MKANKGNDKSIIVTLSDAEALILFEWISRFNENEIPNIFKDQAEQRILFDFESVLEEVVTDIFNEDYNDSLLKAWEKIRDKED